MGAIADINHGFFIELDGLSIDNKRTSNGDIYVVGELLNSKTAHSNNDPTQQKSIKQVFKLLLDRSRGQFLALMRDGNTWNIATDHLGIVPLYLLQTKSVVAISNDLQLLAHRFQLNLNPNAIVELVSTREGITWNGELFHGVQRAEGATIYTVDLNGNLTTDTYTKRKPESYTLDTFEEVFKELDTTIQTVVEKTIRFKSAFIDITGGYDTRKILACLNGLPNFLTGRVVSCTGDKDSHAACNLSSRIGFPLEQYIVSEHSLLEFHLAFHCTRSKIVDDYYQHSSPSMHICGIGGSEIMDAESDSSELTQIVSNLLGIWKIDPSLNPRFIELNEYHAERTQQLSKQFQFSMESGVADPFSHFWVNLFVRNFHGQLFERALLNDCKLISPYLVRPFIDMTQSIPRSFKRNRALSKAYLKTKRLKWQSGFSTYPMKKHVDMPLLLSKEQEEALFDYQIIEPTDWQNRLAHRSPSSIIRWRGLANYLIDGFSPATS